MLVQVELNYDRLNKISDYTPERKKVVGGKTPIKVVGQISGRD
jgi:hypothetical protein